MSSLHNYNVYQHFDKTNVSTTIPSLSAQLFITVKQMLIVKALFIPMLYHVALGTVSMMSKHNIPNTAYQKDLYKH